MSQKCARVASTVILVVVFALTQVTSLRAQTALSCDGDVVTVRVSQIRSGGSIQGFMSAVAAHKAWYRANGIKDNDVVAARVFVKEPTGAMKYSETTVLTYHFRPPAPERTPNRGDATWNAFVRLYLENSDIKAEYTTCMPKSIR